MKTKLSLDHDEARRFGYSDESWARTPDRDRELLRMIQPIRRAQYKVDIAVGRLEAFLADQEDMARKMGGTFAMEPDFQRGHVWDAARKTAFIESWLRGAAPVLFRFNSPGIQGLPDAAGDLHPYDFVCIDGLQRISALIEFTHDAFPVFNGTLRASDLRGTVFDPFRLSMLAEIEVFDFAWREDLLGYYIALNSGGVVHADSEIERVKALREEARAARAAAKPPEPAFGNRLMEPPCGPTPMFGEAVDTGTPTPGKTRDGGTPTAGKTRDTGAPTAGKAVDTGTPTPGREVTRRRRDGRAR